MNCIQVRELLPSFLYRDLKPEEATGVSQHLAACPACAREHAALQHLRQMLDAIPAPAVSVDLRRLYEEAARQQAKRVRRWRRGTLACMVMAATALLAFALKLEISINGKQMVLRWGAVPGTHASAPLPQPAAPVVVRHEPADVPVTAEEMKLVKALIRALAADVDARDRRQQEVVARLQNQLQALQWQDDQHWHAAQRDVTALYTARFGPP